MGVLLKNMDKLTTEVFNQHVISRSREVNRSRDPSPLPSLPQAPSPTMAEDSNECNVPQPIENIGCQDLLEMKCTHCGWLRKRRTLKLFSWPHTYMIIYDGCIYYFKNEMARGAAGKFSLYGYNGVYRASEIPVKDARWCFKIVHSHQDFKTYFFSASSEQEMKVWMSKIKQELLHANGKSATYGKFLHYVKKEEPDKLLEDPSFYQRVEENIYDDSSKFVPSQDYQKQYSIKKSNEESDSDDEDEVDVVNPAIDVRPPLPLPHNEGPFVTLKPPKPLQDGPPTTPLPVKVPMKPPRSLDTCTAPQLPATPPPRRPKANGPVVNPSIQCYSQPHKEKEAAPVPTTQPVALRIQQFNNTTSSGSPKKLPLFPPKRRGSYEKTEGPGNKSPSLDRRFKPNSSGGGGSTGEEDHPSDTDEDCSMFYFDDQDKYKANEILQNIGEEGVYLVRPENQGTGKVLVVGVAGATKKYRIHFKDDEYFLATEGYRHRSIEGLLRYYYENNLPTVEVKLKMPYKNHPKYKPL